MENYDKVITNAYGTTRYTLKGEYHRLDGPAVIYSDGDQEWFKNGLRHREDGAARISANGTQIWVKNGLIHNDNGPAVITSYGDQYWYQNGLKHRINGPAVIFSDGAQLWYIKDRLHREDGPARIWNNGEEEYWKFGIYLNSPNDNPIFLTKDNHYSLYYLNGKFIAGCRKFTKEEAIQHWSFYREDNEERAKLFLIAIRNFKEKNGR